MAKGYNAQVPSRERARKDRKKIKKLHNPDIKNMKFKIYDANTRGTFFFESFEKFRKCYNRLTSIYLKRPNSLECINKIILSHPITN
jgi:hypothetical protein